MGRVSVVLGVGVLAASWSLGVAWTGPASLGAQEGNEKKKVKEAKKKKEASPQDAAFEAMMKAYREAAEPGPAHKALESLVGKWNVKGKFFMDPSAPPMESSGVSTVRSVLGGRFIQEEYRGKSPWGEFQGIGFTGYDNTKKKYSNIWMDTMSSFAMVSEGEMDAEGKVLTLRSKYFDPLRKQEVGWKSVLKLGGPDGHIAEGYEISDAGEFKMMELVYTRRAAKQRAGEKAAKEKTSSNVEKLEKSARGGKAATVEKAAKVVKRAGEDEDDEDDEDEGEDEGDKD